MTSPGIPACHSGRNGCPNGEAPSATGPFPIDSSGQMRQSLTRLNVFLLFRTSILAPPVLSLAAVLYALLVERSLSAEWRDLMTWNGDGAFLLGDEIPSSTLAWVLHWALVAAVGLAAIGALVNQVLLFFYWKPARAIYLASCLVFYPLGLLLGLSITTPLESFLYECSTFLSGMTLALAYHSPVAERFR